VCLLTLRFRRIVATAIGAGATLTIVKIYDVTNDPAVNPAISSTTLLTTITLPFESRNHSQNK